MADLTLPLKGGWVLVTRVPPTVVKPSLFGVYYAKPERVFEQGCNGLGGWLMRQLDEKLTWAIYRQRQNAKLDDREQSLLDRFEKDAAKDGDDGLGDIALEMRVRILTADGEVCLEAHEYSIIADVQPYIEAIGEEFTMHELGGMKQAGVLKDQLFYLRQRGVSKVDAYKMLLGTIDRWNVFWLEAHPLLVRMFTRN